MTRRDPSEWESSVRRPDDFDEYWRQTEADTMAVPLNPRLEPVPLRSTPEVEVFEARYNSYAGLEIAGWYCRPRNIDGQVPGYLFVPGYVSEPKLPTDIGDERVRRILGGSAQQTFAATRFSTRDIPACWSTTSINEPNTVIVASTWTRSGRSIFSAVSMKSTHRASACKGKSRRSPHAASVCPQSRRSRLCIRRRAYLCSMMDAASLTRSYPYEEINDYLRLYPEREDAARDTLDLHDIHNFVDKIKCPIIVNIGLMDDVCPPETGFAVFDQIGSDDKNCTHTRIVHMTRALAWATNRSCTSS